MRLQLGPEIISSYKRLAYEPWYALAEFIDNSTQAYFNNRGQLDRAYARGHERLTVEITTGNDKDGEYIRVKDNSIGMSEDELKNAVVIGRPPSNTKGRSKYGLGLKTGACWFGELWSVETKKLGGTTAHKIAVDVPRVANNDLDLPHTKTAAEPEEHYTIIEIRKLHKRITERIVQRVKNYLRSLYRVDISNGVLILKWNNVALTWDSDVDAKLYRRADGRPAKRKFRFRIGKKRVSGWAGVLAKGSRKEAGFSVIQADRVITGWPDSYRPRSLFGDQEGGSNDLVNQRLLGELFLDGFEVSHTKDRILYDGTDEEMLDLKLERELRGLRKIALTYRKGVDSRVKRSTEAQRQAALVRLEKEIESDQMGAILRTYEVPSSSLIRKTNKVLRNNIVRKFSPDLKAKINRLVVSVYLVKDMSPNDPYVLIESTESETSVIVIINLMHPHWAEITKPESILNFIRDCTYDGVSEWKAFLETKETQPDTVKLIKDNLLRIPMKMKSARGKN